MTLCLPCSAPHSPCGADEHYSTLRIVDGIEDSSNTAEAPTFRFSKRPEPTRTRSQAPLSGPRLSRELATEAAEEVKEKVCRLNQEISRLNQEVSQLSRELRQVMGLLQARLGPPSHPPDSTWLPDLPCPHQRPPCISPHMSGPPPGLQNTTLAVVHCPASVGTVEIGATPSELRSSMVPPFPSEPDPLGPSPVPEASPLTPSLLKHSFQSGSDTFH